MSYDLEFLRSNEIVKVHESRSCVIVGAASPLPPIILRTLQAYHGKRVEARRMDRSDLKSMIQTQLSTEPASGESGRTRDARLGVRIDEIMGGAPAANMVNAFLIRAVRAGASDIHLSSCGEFAQVCFRTDGRLIPQQRVPAGQFLSVSARLKVLAGINAAERRRPQDGRFTAELDGETFDVRFASIPTIGGESLVLRLFRRSGRTFTLDTIGLTPLALSRLRSAIERESGLVLVAGPTGSGKTTTLHACLRELRAVPRKIVTIEDPVEYHLPGIDQIQTNEAVGLTFDSLLKRVLRQDPDVIMVGEIRDPQTAGMSLRAAVTGHLVLSTVHARSQRAVVDRLRGLGVDQDLLESVSPLVLEQRLVRTLCASCHGSGCELCRGAGWRGRTGVFSVSCGDSPEETLMEAGLEKVAAGITSHLDFAWACTA